MLRKIKTILTLPLQTYFWLPVVAVLSFYSFLKFKFAQSSISFGQRFDPAQAPPLPPQIKPSVLHIKRAIGIVKKYAPWYNVCRHQAYQAKILLQLVGQPYHIFVGFKREEGKIAGHAWTFVGNQFFVTGFCNPDEHVVQSVFVG